MVRRGDPAATLTRSSSVRNQEATRWLRSRSSLQIDGGATWPCCAGGDLIAQAASALVQLCFDVHLKGLSLVGMARALHQLQLRQPLTLQPYVAALALLPLSTGDNGPTLHCRLDCRAVRLTGSRATSLRHRPDAPAHVLLLAVAVTHCTCAVDSSQRCLRRRALGVLQELRTASSSWHCCRLPSKATRSLNEVLRPHSWHLDLLPLPVQTMAP
jgi:hypothetical protein